MINTMHQEIELTILMPCLNEAETLGTCIRKADNFISSNRISGEIIIADNGSTDGSIEIARQEGARVIHVKPRGYGAALLEGIKHAQGRYVIMGDADDSYDFLRLENFVEKLRAGHQLVMGNRFKGGILPGAMPNLHRYLGNPVLSFIGKLFFKSTINDFHCGLRGFSREAILKLDLQTKGMEFASEMVVKATLHGLSTAEVPTVLSPDGRSRPPHLRSLRDGWRHLRFLLIFSPRWLFLYPGLFLLFTGIIFILLPLPGVFRISRIGLDIHTILYGALFATAGFQLTSFAIFSKVHGINSNLLPKDPRFEHFVEKIPLDIVIFSGLLVMMSGIAGSIYAVLSWVASDFGELDPRTMMRITVPSAFAISLGLQLIFNSFLLYFLRHKL